MPDIASEPVRGLAPTYYVFKEGSNYKRINAKTGSETLNSSFATIINGAIDAVTAITEGGRIILTGEDAFALATSEVINLKSKVSLEGQGYGTKITKADSGNAIAVIGSSGSEVVNWAVKNLRLSGPSVSGTQVAGCGIHCDFADKGLIENCEISGFGSAGDDGSIQVRRCQEVTTAKCRLHDSKNGFITGKATGITAPEAELCKITESYVYSNFDDGIHSQNSARISITNNHIFLNTAAGIDLLGDDSDTITGNVAYDNGSAGIETGNTTASNNPDRYHTISGNTSRDNGDGVFLNQKTEYCVVSGNTCKANADNGIQLEGATGDNCQWNKVIGNICEGNTGAGILLENVDCNDNYIAHNIVRNNSDRGIFIDDTVGDPTNNIVTLNQVKDNTTANIEDSVTSSTNRVFENYQFINSLWIRSPSLSQKLAAFISMIRKTNIGTSYADLQALELTATGSQHASVAIDYETEIDFTNMTQVKAQWYHSIQGTGTQDIRVVDASNSSNVLFEVTGITTGGKKSFALANLPSWATGVKTISTQCKSSISTDDPNIVDMAIWLV
jgi:hypothetical protein